MLQSVPLVSRILSLSCRVSLRMCLVLSAASSVCHTEGMLNVYLRAKPPYAAL